LRVGFGEMKMGVKALLIILIVAVLLISVLGIGARLAPEERAVRERIAIDARSDSYLYNGADLYVYSDDHSTQKFHVDGATGNLDIEGTGNFAGAVTLQAGAVGSQDVESLMFPTVLTEAITYTAGAGTSGTLATIADGEVWLVHAVFIQTTTTFTDTAGDDEAFTIGDGNDADGFLSAASTQLASDFTEATGFQAGFYGIENGSGGAYTTDDGGPFVYAPSGSAETIDYALSSGAGDDIGAGALTMYVVYTRIQ
jgi:hypothetical protein